MEYEIKENWLSSFMRRVWWTYLVIGGMMIGFAFGTLNMQLEAINQGFMHYNAKTGVKEWGVTTDISLTEKLPQDIFVTPRKDKK